MSEARKILTFPFKLLGKGTMCLFKKQVIRSTEGVSWASTQQYHQYLNAGNQGLLLNGEEAHLSEEDSYQNVCVIARVGAGKTSRYIIPNVLDKARKHCSLVVNDPKGEVFENTSEYMKQCGYEVLVIDPENLHRSSHFNPLAEARNDIEREQVAEILVRCGLPTSQGKDDFWLQGAIRFVSLFIKCLKNAGQENSHWFNLHNLYYLFQHFGQNGEALDDFMCRYTVNPEEPQDESLWNEWQGVLTGNLEGIQSFVLNAITSLKSLSNRNIAKLTAQSDIKLEDIRQKKTIIYLITPPQHAEYYRFLTSLFFRSVFNACMRTLPNRHTLPVYVLYDEFGHSQLPNFVSTANTIRGYKVSLSIVLQSIGQLQARYGHDAEAIQGGFNTYLSYAGADPKTAQFFETLIGKVKERQKRDWDDPIEQYHEYSLMNAGQVRMLEPDEALLVSSHRQPAKLKTTPYFKNSRFKRQAKKGACSLTGHQNDNPLQKISL